MSKKNTPGSGFVIRKEENSGNRFGNFLNQFLDRTAFGSKEGRQAKYDESKKSFLGFPLPEFGLSEYLNLPDGSIARKNQENKKIQQEKERRAALGLDDDTSKPPSFEDVMGIGFKDYLSEVAKIGEEAKNKDMLRSGISALAASPLIGSQAAMESAANISKLTGVNMAAIANQGDVMAQNPTKQKIAGRYFR